MPVIWTLTVCGNLRLRRLLYIMIYGLQTEALLCVIWIRSAINSASKSKFALVFLKWVKLHLGLKVDRRYCMTFVFFFFSRKYFPICFLLIWPFAEFCWDIYAFVYTIHGCWVLSVAFCDIMQLCIGFSASSAS